MSTTSMDPHAAPRAAAPPVPAKHRPGGLPVWGWVLIGVGALGSLMMGLLVLVGLNMYLTHDLLHEDFTSSDGAFATGEHRGHSFAVTDGTYVITSLDAGAGGAFAYASLARTAFALRADVDVVSVSSAGPSFVGVACASAGAADGYYLSTSADGTGVLVARMSGELDASPIPLAVDETAQFGPVTSLRLECAKPPMGDAVNLTGYVNGERAITATDTVGIDGFASVVLMFAAPDAGAEAVFDNVDVIVPE